MDKLEDSYMLLKSGDFWFLLPVSCVKRVTDIRTWKGRLLAASLEGGEEAGKNCRGNGGYLILLDTVGKSFHDRGMVRIQEDAAFGILADEAAGITEASEVKRFDLPAEVMSGRNPFLCGAAFLKRDGEDLAAFLIDPGRLIFTEHESGEESMGLPGDKAGNGENS